MSQVELASFDGHTETNWTDDADQSHLHRTQSALPPTDSGYQAWLCLFGLFLANMLVWGFAFSFGILQEYYSSHEPFASNPNGIPAVGTTATGLSYLTMPLFFIVFQKWPLLRRMSTFASIPMIAAAFVGASFANTVTHLILCQGVLYALAGNMLITPTLSYMDEWFVRRKGLAVGITMAGDGVGGSIMPLIMQALLSSVGFRWTLRIIAAVVIIPIIPMLFFLKPRVPISKAQAIRPIDLSFIRSSAFWTLQVFNTLQALGYFLPSNYLPSYAESLGLSPTLGSITLLFINLASIFACLSVGALVDRFDVTTVLMGVSTLAASTIFLIWGFSASFAPLCVFSLAYGLTAGGYSSAWGGMVKDVQQKYQFADGGMLFGFLAAGRGVGAVISGPLSESLLGAGKTSHSADNSAYGSSYNAIIVFSGCTALAGGFSWMARRAGWI